MLNSTELKKDFKIFEHNPNIIYLDSAATSLKPTCVVEAMSKYYNEYPFSINRGSYEASLKPTELYNKTRISAAKLLNIDPEEIIFTRSTTTSLNYLPHSLEHIFEEEDEIIVSNMEHHSNFLPWLELSKKKNLKLKIVKANDNLINIEEIKKMATKKTKLIAIHHVSNVIGDEVDIKELCEFTRKEKIISVIDGAQAAPHKVVNLKEIGCDFYTISGHKILGPTGIGILYVNKKIQSLLKPFEYGGDMVVPSSVDYNEYTPKNKTRKFEAGTPSIAEVIGLGQAIDYLLKIGLENIQEHERKLKDYALKRFEELEDIVTIYNKEIKNGLITFNIKDVSVHDAMTKSMLNETTFDSENIILRDGQHCNNLTMKYVIKEKAVLRASFYFYNSKEDVDKLIEAIKKIYKVWH